MLNNRSRNKSNMPKLVASLLAAVQIPDLRNKIFFTIFMLIIFRFVAHVPVPGVDTQALGQAFEQNAILGFLDLFSGGALKNLSIAALGVYPYITASIVIQILTPAVPQLKELSQEGEFGRQKINQITHYIMIPIALLQSWGQLTLLNQAGVFNSFDFGLNFITLTIMISMVAGTAFLVWIGELISERGLGNGVSLIIFGGIVSNLPNILGQGLYMQNAIGSLIVLIIFTALIIYTIVLFSEAQRRIPVQYGKTIMRGGQVQRQTGSSILPIKVNSAGMIPLIFAFSIVILPATIAGFFVNPLSDGFGSNLAKLISGFFDPTNLPYWIFVFILVVIFTFFYTLVTFQQQNLSENLQKQSGFIPGIRPGLPTQEYLNKVIIRITWAGALFLGGIAIVPFFITGLTGVKTLTLSSTSLLIMVGVALDTMRQLESQLLMRNYQGFMD